jgi:RNA polymerase sigma factor (sigma-70 family)
MKKDASTGPGWTYWSVHGISTDMRSEPDTHRERGHRPDTQKTLLEGVKVGDPRAWQTLYEDYWQWLLGICLSKGIPHADAQELVQRVFIRVNEKIKDFEYDRSRGRFSSWLEVILRNLIIARWHKGLHDPLSQRDVRTVSSTETAPLYRIAGSRNDEVANQVLARELTRLFQRAYAELKAEVSARQWRVFEAYSIADRPAKDVATEMRVATGTVYSTGSRLTDRLRAIISRMLSQG